MFAYHSISIKARGENYLLFHSYQKILSTLLQWYKSLLLKLLLCGRCDVREEENESQRVGTVEEEESGKGYRESEDLFDSSEKKNSFIQVFVTSDSVLLWIKCSGLVLGTGILKKNPFNTTCLNFRLVLVDIYVPITAFHWEYTTNDYCNIVSTANVT